MRDCPVVGCESRIANHLLVCSADWHHVPPRLRRRLADAQDRARAQGATTVTNELLEAQQAVVASANAGRCAA